MKDTRYERLLGRLSEAFLTLCDESEMLKYRIEELRGDPKAATDAYKKVAVQKIAEVEALERYIEAREEILDFIEHFNNETLAAKPRRVAREESILSTLHL